MSSVFPALQTLESTLPIVHVENLLSSTLISLEVCLVSGKLSALVLLQHKVPTVLSKPIMLTLHKHATQYWERSFSAFFPCISKSERLPCARLTQAAEETAQDPEA